MSLTIEWATDSEAVTSAGEIEISSSFHVLEFDAVTSVRHTWESEITEHVVESGAAISDHKRRKPDRVEIRAMVTNTPIGAPPRSGFAVSTTIASVQAGAADAAVLQFSEPFDRIADVLATLQRLRSEAIDLTVVTRERTYDNVQITSATVARENSDDSIELDISIVEVRRAETQTVEAPLPREPRAQGRSETSAATDAEDATDQDENSWLWGLVT